jgi:uncharacterized protein (TIGR02285 family)
MDGINRFQRPGDAAARMRVQQACRLAYARRMLRAAWAAIALVLMTSLAPAAAVVQAAERIEWALPEIPPVFFYMEGRAPARPADLGRGSGDRYLYAIISHMPGFRHEITGMPYVRGWAEMERGRTLCMPVVLRASSRKGTGWFTPMSPLPPLTVVTRADRAADVLGSGPSVSLEQLIARPDLSGVVQSGRSYGLRVDGLLRSTEGMQRIQPLRNADGQQAATLLRLGRADYWVEYPHVAEWQVRTLDRRPPLTWRPVAEFNVEASLHVTCTRNEAGRRAIEAIDRAIRKAARTPAYRDAGLSWYPPEVQEAVRERFYRWFDERARSSQIE